MPAPRRSDARRNRDAILRAACEAFTRATGTVGVREVARLAGVGQSTVYRHFPDRHALAVAVVGEQLTVLGRLVAEKATEPAAFRPLLEVVLRSQAAMRPLVATLRELPLGDQQRYAERLVAALGPPLRRAREARLVRPGVCAADLVLVLAMLEAAVERAAEGLVGADAVDRAIDVLLAGLFVDPDAPLSPVPPVATARTSPY